MMSPQGVKASKWLLWKNKVFWWVGLVIMMRLDQTRKEILSLRSQELKVELWASQKFTNLEHGISWQYYCRLWWTPNTHINSSQRSVSENENNLKYILTHPLKGWNFRWTVLSWWCSFAQKQRCRRLVMMMWNCENPCDHNCTFLPCGWWSMVSCVGFSLSSFDDPSSQSVWKTYQTNISGSGTKQAPISTQWSVW